MDLNSLLFELLAKWSFFGIFIIVELNSAGFCAKLLHLIATNAKMHFSGAPRKEFQGSNSPLFETKPLFLK